MAFTGYYDGTSIIIDGKFKQNQKFIVIPIEENNKNAAAGKLHKYAKNANGKKIRNEAQEAALERYQHAL